MPLIVWFVVGLLGGLALGFAYIADKWKQRAEFWEHAYLDRAVKLQALVDLSEEYVDSAVLRVLPKRRDERQVFH